MGEKKKVVCKKLLEEASNNAESKISRIDNVLKNKAAYVQEPSWYSY